MIASIAPRAFSVFERNVFVYRRQWLMIVTGFFEPLFFLLGIDRKSTRLNSSH